MSKSNAFENALLLLIFNNTDIANIGDAAGLQNSAAAGNLYMTLHTSDPGEAGTSITNEIAYTSYARVAVARSGSGFTVTTNSVALAADAVFPAGTGGSGTATHWGIVGGVSTTPADNLLLYKGAISPNIVCGNGVTPRLTAGTVVTED